MYRPNVSFFPCFWPAAYKIKRQDVEHPTAELKKKALVLIAF
jgi:hypothetical protein